MSIGDKKLSAILGELIWEEISQCIIHECLLYSIPTNSSQLDKYNTVWTLLQFVKYNDVVTHTENIQGLPVNSQGSLLDKNGVYVLLFSD